MNAFQITDFSLEHLQPVDLPVPEPQSGEVLVKIHANSLNYRDLMMVQSYYKPAPPLPLTPLSDASGTIAAVGAGVTHLKVGDPVCLPFFPTWLDGETSSEKTSQAYGGGTTQGLLRREICVPANVVLPKPSHLTHAQAAALPCAGVTAWNALFTFGHQLPGQTVLLIGTGGVSIFGLQLARNAGATVIIISSSHEKLERARAMGADFTINYKEKPDWEKEVRTITNGAGVDLTLEVGGQQYVLCIRSASCLGSSSEVEKEILGLTD